MKKRLVAVGALVLLAAGCDKGPEPANVCHQEYAGLGWGMSIDGKMVLINQYTTVCEPNPRYTPESQP